MTVNKIKSMLQDIEISKEMNNEFQSYLKQMMKNLRYEMSIQVLTQGCWPESEQKASKIPDELKEGKDAFETYYRSKYAGKNLTFLMSHGECEVLANYEGNKKFTLIVSNYQLSILLILNRKPTSSFEELKSLLDIPEGELTTHLFMLCKLKILDREDDQHKESFENSEKIVVNENFVSQIKRINCKPVRAIGGKKNEENVSVEKDVSKEREFLIDAAIIRIMKSRRILDYNSIQSEIKKLITMFVPDPLMIKRRIESLCERDYIKRDDNDKQIFKLIQTLRAKFIYVP